MTKLPAILTAIFFLFAGTVPVLAADDNPRSLQIGVVPYLSARILVKSYEPMRQYLEHVLGIPVKIYTANGFGQFLQNAQHGDFDLVITPAHFARLLQQDNKFNPLVRYAKGGRGLVMVARNGEISTLEDLKGKTVAVPFRLSLAAIICVTALQEHGLNDGSNISISEYPSFESALLAVKSGEAAAAVSAPGALQQVSPELRDSVTPVLDTGDYVNLIFMAHPRLHGKMMAVMHNALLKFGKSEEGEKFFTSTGFGEFLPVTVKDMSGLDKYVPITRHLLAEGK